MTKPKKDLSRLSPMEYNKKITEDFFIKNNILPDSVDFYRTERIAKVVVNNYNLTSRRVKLEAVRRIRIQIQTDFQRFLTTKPPVSELQNILNPETSYQTSYPPHTWYRLPGCAWKYARFLDNSEAIEIEEKIITYLREYLIPIILEFRSNHNLLPNDPALSTGKLQIGEICFYEQNWKKLRLDKICSWLDFWDECVNRVVKAKEQAIDQFIADKKLNGDNSGTQCFTIENYPYPIRSQPLFGQIDSKKFHQAFAEILNRKRFSNLFHHQHEALYRFGREWAGLVLLDTEYGPKNLPMIDEITKIATQLEAISYIGLLAQNPKDFEQISFEEAVGIGQMIAASHRLLTASIQLLAEEQNTYSSEYIRVIYHADITEKGKRLFLAKKMELKEIHFFYEPENQTYTCRDIGGLPDNHPVIQALEVFLAL